MEAKWRYVLLTTLAPIAWGTTYYVTQQFLPAESPLWGGAIRALPAGLVLLALSRKRPHGSWWIKSLVLGTLNMGAFFALVYVAAQLLPTSVAATIMATGPLVMMMLAWPLIGEKPQLLSLLGAALGIIGVCTMLFSASGTINPLGVLASLAAMVLSSIGYVLTKRWGAGVDVLSLASWQLIAGALTLIPLALLIEGAPPALDGQAMLAFGYVSIIATAVAYVAWFTGLKHLSAGTVGLLGLLNPITGVLLGLALAGESFTLQQIVGILVVLVGILLGQRSGPLTRKKRGRLEAADTGTIAVA